jgi:histidyl-tRNA synthetase
MSTKPPGGTRDFLPEEIRRREHVIGVIRDVYERHAFEPLETPAFENIETLLGKYGEEGNKLIFKILRRGEHEATGEADLALRYDLTVPLARVVAQYQHALPKYFRRYQIQPVWRADRPARGRFREFFQCDIDAIGSTSPAVEAEILAAVSEVMTRLGFEQFSIRVNHRRLLAALLQTAGVSDALHDTALVAIDKLDKVGAEGVQAELIARGISEAAARGCLALFTAGDSLETARTRLTAVNDTAGLDALRNLDEVRRLAHAAGSRPLTVDISLARGLSYYTGVIMELVVPDLAGSLGGGGRYDNLVGMFLGRDVPACGFSLGLERIIVVMTERGMFPGSIGGPAADVLVATWSEEGCGDALALARDLRSGGLHVEVYPDADRIGKQLKYASSRGISCVAIIGDDERAAGTVAVKNLRTGDQTVVPRERTEAAVRGWLAT